MGISVTEIVCATCTTFAATQESDSVVKNIGREYIAHFASRLSEALMLKRAIIADVLENAETSHWINASQKRALLQEMALRLS